MLWECYLTTFNYNLKTKRNYRINAKIESGVVGPQCEIRFPGEEYLKTCFPDLVRDLSPGLIGAFSFSFLLLVLIGVIKHLSSQ